MKKILLSLCLTLSISSLAFAGAEETIVTSKISAVTIYTRGAEVTEVAKVTLSAGKNVLVFDNIPSQVQPDQMNVSITGDGKILATTHRSPDYYEQRDASILKTLKDSVGIVNEELETLARSIASFEVERKLLEANESIGGQNNGVSVLELQKAADFFRTRLADIDKNVLKLSRRQKKLLLALGRVQHKVDEWVTLSALHNHSIAVTLKAVSPGMATISLTYLTEGAGWAPYYNIRVKDISSPLELAYKAKVFNSTGIPWEGVKLTLSTANPTRNAVKPELTPWTLNYDDRSQMTAYAMANDRYKINDGEGDLSKYNLSKNYAYTYPTGADKLEKKKIATQVAYSEINVSELTTDFEIKEPGLIPADGQAYIVDIQSYNLEASYKYFAIPKMDKDAFLVAQVTGWEELNLMEGPADIFYGNALTGRSYLSTSRANDTLDISLGRDNKVSLSRIKREDFSKKRFFGTNRTDYFIYEISVRNNNPKPINIEIYDQVPVAQLSDISVEVTEISGADLEPLSGKLTWLKTTLPPSETQKLLLKYNVKYPKNKNVAVRKTRAISCPKF